MSPVGYQLTYVRILRDKVLSRLTLGKTLSHVRVSHFQNNFHARYRPLSHNPQLPDECVPCVNREMLFSLTPLAGTGFLVAFLRLFCGFSTAWLRLGYGLATVVNDLFQ